MSTRAEIRRGERAARKGVPPHNAAHVLLDDNGKIMGVYNRCQRRQMHGKAGRRQW